MIEDVLVVYKKNFEAVHDKALEAIRSALDELVATTGLRVDYSVREDRKSVV